MSLNYTFVVVMLGTAILGLVSGALGSFAVLRKQSLLGDAISHAALPGLGLAFLLTQNKHPIVLLTGALLAGWIGTLLVMTMVRNTVIKQDAALGIILSVFFGFGLVLLTIIQRLPTANKSGLNTFLFGSASTLLMADVITMACLSAFTLILMFLFWKEFKVISFDGEFATALGYPVKRLETFLTTLIVISIIIGLQTVGVVLMSAMIIAPASAARQWTNRLGVMVGLSSFFGALSGVIGAALSSNIDKLPTGPTIVLVMSVFVFISLLFAPNRGLVWRAIRTHIAHQNIHEKAMLSNLLLFSESHTDPFYPHDLAALTAIGRGPATKAMNRLLAQGLVFRTSDLKWALTKDGLLEAKEIEHEYRAN